MNVLFPVVAVLALAFAVEGVVEYFLGEPMRRFAPDWSWTLMYAAWLAAAVGVWTYKLDLMQLWLGLSDSWTWFGLVISAAMIGRGSNWLHDFASRFLAKEQSG